GAARRRRPGGRAPRRPGEPRHPNTAQLLALRPADRAGLARRRRQGPGPRALPLLPRPRLPDADARPFGERRRGPPPPGGRMNDEELRRLAERLRAPVRRPADATGIDATGATEDDADDAIPMLTEVVAAPARTEAAPIHEGAPMHEGSSLPEGAPAL